MIKKVFFWGFSLIGFTVFGQDIVKKETLKQEIDTLHFRPGNFTIVKQISVRIGTGLQNDFYSEIGAALHTCRYGDTGYFSKAYYTALEWMPDQNNDIYGIKIGYEISALLLITGLEVKYQTDFKINDVVITPKIGLSIFGDANIFYGYNISTNNTPFSRIRNHQFSIVFNLNKHFLRYP